MIKIQVLKLHWRKIGKALGQLQIFLPGKNTISPSFLGTISFAKGLGLDGANSRSASRSPSSSMPPSTMAKKSSTLTKLPAEPIRAWFCVLCFAYCSRKGSASLRNVDCDSCLCPYFLLINTALNMEEKEKNIQFHEPLKPNSERNLRS